MIEKLAEQDLSSLLLSVAILIGWLGIGFLILRITAVALKTVLEKIFPKK